MMFVCGFGWAKPVPVDPRYFKNPKRGMALTALAGPVSNLLLALAALCFGKAGYLYCRRQSVRGRVAVLLSADDLRSSRIGLGLFNLIPIPPLDGSKVLVGLPAGPGCTAR